MISWSNDIAHEHMASSDCKKKSHLSDTFALSFYFSSDLENVI